ncbi:TfoX/Sxy family protein [Actibacterium sp. 188UL27-1]|uniref:TfoX/Sxy family protein n=1 Tax=Actibacterium sp. 188UL27-1 TaxID=2786961 RepID=UPI00195AB8C4|nr:TfoX/Sxy family protein [Actibacterium sp. 188UL27-1]MBM7070267.1 TfoX/Sxy family protein [Actibacterium sp. 188UL27-1]
MAITDAQIEHALELFSSVGDITTRKMFGGVGLYSHGTIFSVIMSDGTIRLKGTGPMVDRYDALGMQKWVYQRPGQKQSAMPYWALTDDQLDDPDATSALAQEALAHL